MDEHREGVSTTGSGRMKLLMKPAKVPTWTKDLTFETYTKQLLTWTDILEDIPEYIKYADLMECLEKRGKRTAEVCW